MTEIYQLKRGLQTCTVKIYDLEAKVASLEQWANQQNILLDTLGDVMEELKKQEH